MDVQVWDIRPMSTELIDETSPVQRAKRRRRWPAAVLAAVAVLGLGAGTLLWQRHAAGVVAQSPPDLPLPKGGALRVFLCVGDVRGEPCDGQSITLEQKQAVEAQLRALPGITAVRFEDQAMIWAGLYKPAIDAGWPGSITQQDIPEAFRADLSEVSEATAKPFEALPGVAEVSWRRTGFWAGMTDLRVKLCGYGTTARVDSHCEGRSLATDAERQVILDRLQALPEIAELYLENAEHATKDLENQAPTSPGFMEGADYLPGSSFHVKLTDPAGAQAVRGAMAGLPGIDEVEDDKDPEWW
ncbi:permease-like cell division protein FtsX [Nonomuraea sp. NPDC050310]|uniref:permease-like cell division protein FtsX n=1 Tax=Nonomuraea sp. NPDC050310 TaxID=3154935 RepID=UPI0033FB6A25